MESLPDKGLVGGPLVVRPAVFGPDVISAPLQRLERFFPSKGRKDPTAREGIAGSESGAQKALRSAAGEAPHKGRAGPERAQAFGGLSGRDRDANERD